MIAADRDADLLAQVSFQSSQLRCPAGQDHAGVRQVGHQLRLAAFDCRADSHGDLLQRVGQGQPDLSLSTNQLAGNSTDGV